MEATGPPERGLKRLGVFGGTFDPIHTGHLAAASEALHVFDLGAVLFVPAARPWQKSSYSDPEDRYLMTCLAASEHKKFAVSRIELDRQGPTYTVDTLRVLREVYGPDVQLFFILGADALLKLGSWREIDGLADLAELIAVVRSGHDLGDFHPEPSWPKVSTLEMSRIDISSTDIRARVQMGKPIDFLVPPQAARYIAEQGLYRGLAEE